jgi:hypothetical protein
MEEQGVRRVRRSEGEWRLIVERFEASGVSRAEFCEGEGIGLGSFSRWQQKLRDPKRGGKKFIDLWGSAAPRSWRMELDLGSGVVLRIRD